MSLRDDLRTARVVRERDEARALAEDARAQNAKLSVECDVLKAKLAESERERDAARELINRDRTGLANALAGVLKLVQGCSWIGNGEWGSYDYTQQTEATLRSEWSAFEDQSVALIRRALRESGYRADHAFHPSQPDRTEELDALRARLAKTEAVVEALPRCGHRFGCARRSTRSDCYTAFCDEHGGNWPLLPWHVAIRALDDSPVGVAATAEGGTTRRCDAACRASEREYKLLADQLHNSEQDNIRLGNERDAALRCLDREREAWDREQMVLTARIESVAHDHAKAVAERDEALEKVRWFVEKAADEKLDGYRELGMRAANAENERDVFQAALREVIRERDELKALLAAVARVARGVPGEESSLHEGALSVLGPLAPVRGSK